MNVTVKNNVCLADLTSFKIGGITQHLFCPRDLSEVFEVVEFLKEVECPFFVLGKGRNVLIGDDYFAGVVVRFVAGNVYLAEKVIVVDAGASNTDVSIFAGNFGLSGLEFLYGLPGSIGGSVAMNARCYGSEFADVVKRVFAVNLKTGELVSFSVQECKYGYKESIFLSSLHWLIYRVELTVSRGNKKEISKKMNGYWNDRMSKGQTVYPNAGCMFKNQRFGDSGNRFCSSGKLIGDAGLFGWREGGASVYSRHGNFIVNVNSATGRDVCRLISFVRERVFLAFGYKLECEVRFYGNFGGKNAEGIFPG